MSKKKKVFNNIYQRAKMYNFLLLDFKLPPKVSCVANNVWSNSGLLCSSSTKVVPLFKEYTTYDISSIHSRKSNVYAYENQTRDQQNISANLKSTTHNTSDGQLDKSCRFLSPRRRRNRKVRIIHFVLKKKKKKESKQQIKKRILSTCRIPSTQKSQKYQILVFCWIPDVCACTKVIRLPKFHLYRRKVL